MPRAKDHVCAGVMVGFVAAGILIPRETQSSTALSVLAYGALGGAIGGLLPDRLEPARSPRHRKFFHSFLVMALGVWAAYKLFPRASSFCRSAVGQELPVFNEFSRSSAQHSYVAIAVVLIAFYVGLLVGYLSHLGMDGCTKAGLPFLD